MLRLLLASPLLFLSNLVICVDNLFFYPKYVYLVFVGFG